MGELAARHVRGALAICHLTKASCWLSHTDVLTHGTLLLVCFQDNGGLLAGGPCPFPVVNGGAGNNYRT